VRIEHWRGLAVNLSFCDECATGFTKMAWTSGASVVS
jgi:hypothetical protein